jgi:hypothetical protein
VHQRAQYRDAQVWGLRPFGNRVKFMWGAGVLSVMGVSFTTVPIAQVVIGNLTAVRLMLDG